MQAEQRRSVVGGGRWALPVLCTAAFLATMDLSVVSIALPSIQADLGFSVSGVQWVLSAYSLALGGLLLLAGRAGDVLGRRRILLWGTLAFALCSTAGALARAPWMLIAARVGQGAAAAAIVPNSLSLLTSTIVEPRLRERALGFYAATVSAGFVAGTVLGGLATHLLGWRAVLLLNVPVAVGAVPLARRFLPELRAGGSAGDLDIVGALALTAGLSVLIAGFLGVERTGPTSPQTAAGLLGGAALLVAFVLWERRCPRPIIPLDVFTVRPLAVINTASVLQSCVGMTQLYVLTLYFQQVRDADPLQAGLAFLPMAVAGMMAAPAVGRLVNRLGGARTAMLGCTVLAVGLTAVSLQLGTGATLPGIIVATVVAEMGFIGAEVPINAIATTSLERRHGLAAGILSTGTELGNAAGLAVTATIVGVVAGAGGSLTEALRVGLAASVAFAVLAFLVIAVGLRPQIRPSREPQQ